MKFLVGVQFKQTGRIYDFDVSELKLDVGNKVVVETERGIGMGKVVKKPREVADENLPESLKRVIRIAGRSDIERQKKNCGRERQAFELCKKRIKERELDMKLVHVDFYYDASKAIFFFTAEQRVDFRDLVKDMAQSLHTRIEMRQVGVRDETKLIGGMGCCGLTLCCSTFLREFSPVNVKMAKEQNLAMNPAKVSGICGRLMCCLAFEFEIYQELGKGLPKKGKRVMTSQGQGKVTDVDVLKRQVSIELESGGNVILPAEKVKKYQPTKQELEGTRKGNSRDREQGKNRGREQEKDSDRGQRKGRDRNRGRDRRPERFKPDKKGGGGEK